MCCPKAIIPRKGAKINLEPYQTLLCLDPKRVMMRVRFPAPMWNLDVHEDCVHNQLRAVKGRALGVIPRIDPAVTMLLRPVITELSSVLHPQPGVSLEASVAEFPRKRRKRYEKALADLLSTGLMPKDAIISSFVKMEKLQIVDKDGDPRIIQTRNSKFHLVFSQMTKPVEHALINIADPVSGMPLIAKGRNLDERAVLLRDMWAMKTAPVALSLDLSRWDMHVQVPLLLEVIALYQRHTNDPLITWCSQQLLFNRCFTNKRIRYKVEGGVMSGDMTTALGNCIAVIAIVLTFREVLYSVASAGVGTLALGLRTNPTFTQAGRDFLEALEAEALPRLPRDWMSVLDDGDDHVVIIEAQHADMVARLLPLWWTALGHSLKVEGRVTSLENIEFCQHKPFIGTHRVTMVPNPCKVIPKSCLVTGKYIEDPLPYLRTVYMARAMLHKHIPVLGPFFQAQAKALGHGRMVAADSREFSHINSSLHYLLSYTPEVLKLPDQQIVEEEDRYLMWKMWDITPTDQMFMESWEIKNQDWFRVINDTKPNK